MLMMFRLSFLVVFLLSHQFNANSQAEPIKGSETYSTKQSYAFVVLISQIASMGKDEQSICTGSLISKNQVLTVASCLENQILQNLEVFVGSSSPASSDFHVFRISSKVTYKDYEDESERKGIFIFRQIQDICILSLNTLDTGFNPGVISYELDRPTFGDDVTFIGWGPTRDRYPPHVPRYVTLQVKQKQECDDKAKVFSPNYRKLLWANKVFCAQKGKAVNAVDGDFGGPVLFDGNKLIGMAIRPRPIPEEIKQVSKQPILVLRLGTYKDFIEKYLMK